MNWRQFKNYWRSSALDVNSIRPFTLFASKQLSTLTVTGCQIKLTSFYQRCILNANLTFPSSNRHKLWLLIIYLLWFFTYCIDSSSFQTGSFPNERRSWWQLLLISIFLRCVTKWLNKSISRDGLSRVYLFLVYVVKISSHNCALESNGWFFLPYKCDYIECSQYI